MRYQKGSWSQHSHIVLNLWFVKSVNNLFMPYFLCYTLSLSTSKITFKRAALDRGEAFKKRDVIFLNMDFRSYFIFQTFFCVQMIFWVTCSRSKNDNFGYCGRHASDACWWEWRQISYQYWHRKKTGVFQKYLFYRIVTCSIETPQNSAGNSYGGERFKGKFHDKKGLYNRCFPLYFVIFSRTADLYERLVLLIKFF